MVSFTPRERKALIFVSSFILISIIYQWIWPHKVNTRVYDYTLQDSIFRVLSADTNGIFSKEAAELTMEHKAGRPKKKKKIQLRKRSIEINTATQKELEKLPRIGPATAKRIIEYRETHGGFKSVDELIKVKRIGPKTLEKIRPFVFVKGKKDSLQKIRSKTKE